MRILEIHQLGMWIKTFKFLKDDILTFDDGLFSQFFFFHYLPKENIKIFFISTNIINFSNKFNLEFLKCDKAHELFFKNNDTTNYMSVEQIKYLQKQQNTFIGSHGHYHYNFELFDNNLEESYLKAKDDIEKNKFYMDKYFNIKKIKYFCYPYNYDKNIFYNIYIKKLNKDIILFGNNRIDIMTLLT